MACFLVPAGEAVVTAVAAKALQSHRSEAVPAVPAPHEPLAASFARRLNWLTNLLLGGAVLLLFEHAWHGEIIPVFPFLTAAMNAADTAEMLHEMASVGVTMALFVTVLWAGLVLAARSLEKRALPAARSE